LGFGLLVLLAGGYGLWWRHLTEMLRADLDHWVAERAAVGWKISTGAVAVSGFPLHVVLTLSAPGVEDPSGNAWQGPALAVVIPLFDPQHPHLEAPGEHVVAIKGREPVHISIQGASADLAVDGHGLNDLSLDLAMGSAGSAHLGRSSLQLRRLAAGQVAHDVPSWSLRLSLENLGLPDDPRLLFGPLLSSIQLEAHLQGSVTGGAVEQALRAWRDDGGTVEIDRLSVDWKPLALSGTGTLALDRDLQPMVASNCDIRGLFEAVDALTRSGVVRPQDAGMVKLIFGLMMKSDKNGAKTLSVPLTIQNRVLSVGPVKLLELPVLPWH
jgi:hypothetical protein